jgi:DNA invertase Pin-like site-specific DNA recombinase
MNVALYCRVSTDQQTLEPQHLELRNYCEIRSWKIVEEFTDVISGSKSSREGLDRMMAGVRTKAFDCVLAVEISRFARSVRHFAQMVYEFDKHGVAMVIPRSSIDTSASNPAGRLIMNVLASVAEFERECIRTRTVAGLAAAKARGVRLGKPSKNLAADHARIVAEWRAEGGKHLRDLACRLGGVSVSFAHKLSRAA